MDYQLLELDFPAGHWKLRHTLKNLAIIQVNLLIQFLLFTLIRNAPGLFESFGFVDVKPVFIAFSLFSAVSAPLNEVPILVVMCSLASITIWGLARITATLNLL